MEFTIKTGTPEKLATDTIVVSSFAEDNAPGAAFAALDTASEGRLGKIVSRDLEARPGALLNLPDLPGTLSQRVLVVSLGAREDFNQKIMRDVIAAVGKHLAGSNAAKVAVCLGDEEVPDRTRAWTLQQLARGLADATYRFSTTKNVPKEELGRGPRKITVLTQLSADKEAKTALAQGHAIAEGMALTRELGNLPANVCTPTYLAETAEKMGKEYKFKVDVLERKDMEKLGMGAMLSVADGSRQPPKFIVMHYNGSGKEKPIALVGKGITFDTGGISLKPAPEMDEMKFDMCGAAAVFGLMKATALMKLPLNIVAIVPATENMPGGNATKPGDVVTSMSGQTIEVLNTDAEGRLVLCDALTYAERFKPDYVIDMATLTGAVIIGLGRVPSGLMANDDEFAAELLTCGETAGDRAWRLPIWDEYQDQLKSNFADIANIGGRPAGSITAACFLSRFTKAYKWAHLDIAGTAWVQGENKGATGRPVPLVSEFLINRSNAAKP